MTKQAVLLQQTQKIFSTADLALLWGITKRNTLLTTIKRYKKNSILFVIRKGLYSVIPLDELSSLHLGTVYIRGFCYVSLQTVLAINGLINQEVQKITLVGGRSKSFSAAGQDYICRKLKPACLHNLLGIDFSQSYPMASVERAVADILYFNPRFHLDAKFGVDYAKLKLIQQKVYS